MKKNGCTIYIGNLNYQLDDEAIKKLFTKYGKVQWIKVMKGPDGKKTGVAFLFMPNREQGEQAIKKLDGLAMAGRYLKVSEAEEREESKPKAKPIKKQEKGPIPTPVKPKKTSSKKFGLDALFNNLKKNKEK